METIVHTVQAGGHIRQDGDVISTRAWPAPVLATGIILALLGCGPTATPKAPAPGTVAALTSARDEHTSGARTSRAATGHRRKGPLHGITVGIDPGHNGDNYKHPHEIDRQVWNGREYENCNTTGTETDGGYTEAMFNFRVASDLRRDLLREGAHVVLTRHNNHGVGPCVNKRAKIINHSHATVGIDIHADGGPADGRGFAILEPVKDKQNHRVVKPSAHFGRELRRSVLAHTPMPTSTYDGHDGINKSRDDLAGLNLTKVPLVLIECGNMRNSTDARLLIHKSFQHRLARAFASAITGFARQRQHR